MVDPPVGISRINQSRPGEVGCQSVEAQAQSAHVVPQVPPRAGRKLPWVQFATHRAGLYKWKSLCRS